MLSQGVSGKHGLQGIGANFIPENFKKEFIDEINPKYSIISVGKNNRYGHPNKEVLKNLSDSKIYRTDQDGSIMFKIKNNKLKNRANISLLYFFYVIIIF